ncbi:hypothetical protein OS187_12210 [Xanthomonadaceae bacterium JHOS43]|nr:hypothetical protein [Xanthomonadaceae bacterium JHOS43]
MPLPAKEAPVPARTRIVTPDPAVQLKGLVHQFRVGDVTGLAQALIPPSKWEDARDAYDQARQKPLDEKDREHFAEQLERFTAPDAVDALMAELEPKLEQARPQWPGMLMLGMGAAQMAVASPDADLDEAQREALRRMLPGLQRWVGSTDFLDSVTLRQALTLFADGVRRTGIRDLESLRQLPLEGMLDRAGTLLVAGKDALRLYGLDLDAVADSLNIEVLSGDGFNARVHASVTLFGASVGTDLELVLIDGRWYGASVVKTPDSPELALAADR